MSATSTLSDALGWTSIICWLGAQFPQVLENIRNQSCDGLALPFLLNWLLGDATNLLGCVLTHQLPFQTYLATYFCFVDFSLLSQYFYYSRSTYPPLLSRRASLSRPSVERAHYRTLSSVAANVAAAAALAAHEHEPAHTYYDDDEVDEDALARLADSFHSARSEGVRVGAKHVSWSRERGGSLSSRRPPLSPTGAGGTLHQSLILFPPAEGGAETSGRGRSLSRAEEEWADAQRRSSKASRRGASMVFMGVWALAGVGAFGVGRSGSSASSGRGKVVARADVPGAEVMSEVSLPHVPEARPVGVDTSFAAPEQASDSDVAVQFVDVPVGEPFETPADPPPSTEFIIGRISAWVCTTLYLTSRLPQIWKNYVRKSVEGLSIYLFIFAFLGNFFYVASILTSPMLRLPPVQAAAFLRESIPYLLGSGGTLMFDVTIVAQSFLYDPKRKRGRALSRPTRPEEAGLLAAEEPGVRRRIVGEGEAV